MLGGYCVLFYLLVYFAEGGDWTVKEAENVIAKSLQCKNNPGLAVSVVTNGSIVMARGFGVKSNNSSEPVTNTTMFHISSLTKGFTSTLLVKLLGKHQRFRLNTTVAEIFGNNNIFSDSLRSKYVTVEDLLAHRVGLPGHGRIRFDSSLNRQNLIKRLKYLKADGEFRVGFYYSDILYGLVTAIAEKISGKSWENLVFEEVFVPLGMTSSELVTTVNWSTADLAEGYFDNYGELVPVPNELTRRWESIGGSGGILSNAVDMAKWMLFHLNGGKNQEGQQVIDKVDLDQTYKAKNIRTPFASSKNFLKPITPVSWSTPNYALGWRRGMYRGYEIVDNIGSFWGYRNMITLIPEMNIGIFTAMNGGDDNYRVPLQLYLADVFLGKQPWLNESTLCTFPEPWSPAALPAVKPPDINKDLSPARSISQYIGTYRNPAYGSLAVTQSGNNALFITYGWANFQLYPSTTPDIFTGEAIGTAANTLSREHTGNQNTGNRFIFKYDPHRKLISSLTIPGLERKDPPEFVSDIVAKNLVNYGSYQRKPKYYLVLCLFIVSMHAPLY